MQSKGHQTDHQFEECAVKFEQKCYNEHDCGQRSNVNDPVPDCGITTNPSGIKAFSSLFVNIFNIINIFRTPGNTETLF